MSAVEAEAAGSRLPLTFQLNHQVDGLLEKDHFRRSCSKFHCNSRRMCVILVLRGC
jgi:hypothetical protein